MKRAHWLVLAFTALLSLAVYQPLTLGSTVIFGTDVLSSFPTCSSTFNGGVMYASDKAQPYYCTGSVWVPLNSGPVVDDSANTGNRTVNSVRGISAFAGAGTAITITNSYVTSTSTVLCVLQTNDATALLKNCVPAAGSFTINLNVAATGTTKVSWIVLN